MSDVLHTDDWEALLGRYAKQLEQEDRSPLTVRNYTRELRAFARYHRETFGEPPEIKALTPEDLRDYRNHLLKGRTLKPATVNLARAALAGLIKWAHAERILKEAIRTPKTVRQGVRGPRWLTRPQERRLWKVVRKAGDPHHLALLDLMVVFGTRISETASLTWGRLTMGRKTAELRVLGKGNKERVLPFLGNERARDAFLALGWKEHGAEKGRRIVWGQRGPLSASGIKQLLTPYGRAAGLERFSAHVLRHTCARRMHERGESIQVIARWMGHENLNTTFLYTLPSEEDLARAAGASGEGWGGDWGDDD
jgi:integrase/recombinase XerC